MSSIGDSEHDAQKRGLNIKGLWRDAFRTLKSATTSSSGSADDETRPVSSRSIIYAYLIHVRYCHNRSNKVIQTRDMSVKEEKKERIFILK